MSMSKEEELKDNLVSLNTYIIMWNMKPELRRQSQLELMIYYMVLIKKMLGGNYSLVRYGMSIMDECYNLAIDKLNNRGIGREYLPKTKPESLPNELDEFVELPSKYLREFKEEEHSHSENTKEDK